jgi:GT2 family glycosyltransferase
MSADVDVVIPVYKHYELTDSCLRHLRAQTQPHRVIVVDDGSDDGGSERLRRDWPDVTVITLPANVGYARACNRGVRSGEAPFVVLLNNDVELDKNCLARAVQPLRDDPATGSVATLMLQVGGERIDSFGVTADPTLAGFARLHGLPAGAAATGRMLLSGPEGTAGAYRRSAWEQVGGFDEGIRAYMEILDLALRLQAAGWTCTGVAAASGVHLGSRTYGRLSRTQRELAGYSRGYLLRRYGVLRRRVGARALATEAVVVVGDALQHRDVAALAGRLRGWRAARGRPRRPWPPARAVDGGISFSRSIALRLGKGQE